MEDVGVSVGLETRTKDIPGRSTMRIPASLAASYMGAKARQSSKSSTPGAGFVAPTMILEASCQ